MLLANQERRTKMNKKLTPLKALKEIGKLKENGCYINTTVEYKIAEAALKEYELMKQTKIIVTDKKVSDDDLEKLKNQRKVKYTQKKKHMIGPLIHSTQVLHGMKNTNQGTI